MLTIFPISYILAAEERAICMKFSLWNFKEWYSSRGIDLSYVITDNTASISMLASSPSAADGRIGCAIVRSAEQCTDCSGFHTVLEYGNDRILFPVASPVEIWNLGNAMIQQYTDWEEELLQCVASFAPIEKLFDISQKQFPFPFSCILANGTILHHSSDYARSLTAAEIQTILSAARKNSQPICRTFLFDRSQTFLLDQIATENSPIAVLAAYETEQRLSPSHIVVFHVIACCFQLFLQRQMQHTVKTHPFANWLHQSIATAPEQALVPPNQWELDAIKWKENDFYQVASMRQKADSPAAFSDLCSQLSAASDCYTMTDSGVSVLFHLGSEYQSIPSEQALLSPLCLDKYDVGLSLPFRGLLQVRAFHQQSIWAVAQASTCGQSPFLVSEHSSRYLLQLCHSLPNASAMIHPDMLRLSELDHSGNDDLLKSLYAYYIMGRSISRAADSLYIHRNTLRLRLKKIQSFLSVDLDDADVQQRYLLSLLLCLNA